MPGKCVGAVITAAMLAAPSAALAAPSNTPSANASCAGSGSVFNQAHPEVFGSRSHVAHAFIDIAAVAGIPPGAIYTGFAQTHGVAETCLG
jgi:hypothetical protein